MEQIYSQLYINKDIIRAELADSLAKELGLMAPNRLLFLLNQGVKQLYTNKKMPSIIDKYDIFTARIYMLLKNESNFYKEIKF